MLIFIDNFLDLTVIPEGKQNYFLLKSFKVQVGIIDNRGNHKETYNNCKGGKHPVPDRNRTKSGEVPNRGQSWRISCQEMNRGEVNGVST